MKHIITVIIFIFIYCVAFSQHLHKNLHDMRISFSSNLTDNGDSQSQKDLAFTDQEHFSREDIILQSEAAENNKISTAKSEPDVIARSIPIQASDPDTVILTIPASQPLIAPSHGQFSVKINLLYAALTSINLGVEVALAPKWTLSVMGGLNPWTFSDNTKWKYWSLQPELRYWFCERFDGSFIGVHLLGGQYNFGNLFSHGGKYLDNDHDWLFGLYPDLGKYRYQGWFYGGGVSYGYQWMLGRHWNLESSIGIGYLHLTYDKFDCPKCGAKIESGETNYIGPTTAAISLIYMF